MLFCLFLFLTLVFYASYKCESGTSAYARFIV